MGAGCPFDARCIMARRPKRCRIRRRSTSRTNTPTATILPVDTTALRRMDVRARESAIASRRSSLPSGMPSCISVSRLLSRATAQTARKQSTLIFFSLRPRARQQFSGANCSTRASIRAQTHSENSYAPYAFLRAVSAAPLLLRISTHIRRVRSCRTGT